jgi:hypothetical protein
MNAICQTLRANQALIAYIGLLPSGGGIVTHYFLLVSMEIQSQTMYWADL